MSPVPATVTVVLPTVPPAVPGLPVFVPRPVPTPRVCRVGEVVESDHLEATVEPAAPAAEGVVTGSETRLL